MLLFSCSVTPDSFATPLTVDHQAPLSTGFPRQKYWSGLPFPFPEDLPNLGIESTSPSLQEDFFAVEQRGLKSNDRHPYKATWEHRHTGKVIMWRWKQRWELWCFKPKDAKAACRKWQERILPWSFQRPGKGWHWFQCQTSSLQNWDRKQIQSVAKFFLMINTKSR